MDASDRVVGIDLLGDDDCGASDLGGQPAAAAAASWAFTASTMARCSSRLVSRMATLSASLYKVILR